MTEHDEQDFVTFTDWLIDTGIEPKALELDRRNIRGKT